MGLEIPKVEIVLDVHAFGLSMIIWSYFESVGKIPYLRRTKSQTTKRIDFWTTLWINFFDHSKNVHRIFYSIASHGCNLLSSSIGIHLAFISFANLLAIIAFHLWILVQIKQCLFLIEVQFDSYQFQRWLRIHTKLNSLEIASQRKVIEQENLLLKPSSLSTCRYRFSLLYQNQYAFFLHLHLKMATFKLIHAAMIHFFCWISPLFYRNFAKIKTKRTKN